MSILLYLARRLWAWGQDYPSPTGEDPAQTLARYARDAELAVEARPYRTARHVQLTQQLGQQRIRP